MSDLLRELKNFSEWLFDGNLIVWSDMLDTIIKKYDWHPVSESPKESGWYQITEKRFVSSDPDVEKCWYNAASSEWETGVYSEIVVAWMPIPEPYKQENNNE